MDLYLGFLEPLTILLQAISSKKGEVAFELAGKRHKVDMTHEAERKAAASTPTDVRTTGAHQEAEKTLEKRNSGEILVLSSSKEHSTTLQQSPRNIKQTCLPAPALDRFKLDSSPTSFRVVPPLPAEFANVSPSLSLSHTYKCSMPVHYAGNTISSTENLPCAFMWRHLH